MSQGSMMPIVVHGPPMRDAVKIQRLPQAACLTLDSCVSACVEINSRNGHNNKKESCYDLRPTAEWGHYC
jgi:hypothetical protein